MSEELENGLVSIDPNGGQVSIHIRVVTVHRGSYQLFLWNAANQNPVQIGRGLNFDNVPDIWPINEHPSALRGRAVSWQGLIEVQGPNQTYDVEVHVIQAGVERPGSPVVRPNNQPVTQNAYFGQLRFV